MDCAAKALPGWPQGRMILIQSPEPSMCKDLQLRDRGSQGPPWKTARCQPYRGIRKLISWQVQEPQDILETSRKKEFAWNNLWWNTVGSWLPGLRTTNKTLSKVQPEILMGTSSKANSRGPTWWINTLTAHTETIRPNETSLVSWSRIIFQMNFIKSWETKGGKKKTTKNYGNCIAYCTSWGAIRVLPLTVPELLYNSGSHWTCRLCLVPWLFHGLPLLPLERLVLPLFAIQFLYSIYICSFDFSLNWL